MIEIITGFSVALIITLFATPLFIKFLIRQQYGQFVRDDGPTTHHVKRGTPTMGGAVFVIAVIIAYFIAHLIGMIMNGTVGVSPSGLLALFLTAGMGFVGFLDDYKKISQKQSLGLRARWKIFLQLAVGIIFALLALQFPNGDGITPASYFISFVRDVDWLNLAFLGTGIGTILVVLWANFLITAITNGVNLTDGLDGLAAGASIMVFGGYALITIWQFSQTGSNFYKVASPLDLTLFAVAFGGALIGFLWWNAPVAKIFMGDTGSLAIGGGIAALAILSRTELLLVVLGGLFVIITLSVMLQVGYFRISGGKRIFKMAPLQHHFEIKGWPEVTVVIRFWIICGIFVSIALAIFYADWLIRA